MTSKFPIKLVDGSEVILSLDNFFLMRMCKLLNTTISGVFFAIEGEWTRYKVDKDFPNAQLIDGEYYNTIVRGGLLDDLEIRACAISAGMDSHDRDTLKILSNRSLVEGFEVLEKIPESLTNKMWSDLYLAIVTMGQNTVTETNTSTKKKAVKKAVARKKA